MGPRLFQTIIISGTSSFDEHGDVVLAAGTSVLGAVWHRRLKAVIGSQGEVDSITAQGFLASGASVAVGDRLLVSGTGQRYDVVTVVSAYDDRGRLDHVGVELRDI